MRRFLSALILFCCLNAWCVAQTVPASNATTPDKEKQKQKPPSKDDPQGYSKDVLDEPNPDLILKHPKQPSKKPSAAPVAIPEGLADLVHEQFGKGCEVSLKQSSMETHYLHPPAVGEWTPFFAGDLDGDGVEDAVIIARCKHIVGGAEGHNYKVSDPYFSYHGYGNPKITEKFSSDDPKQGNVVLIIHGVGPEAWRADQPKAKFAFINLPFDNVSFMHTVIKKKAPPQGAVLLESDDDQDSILYWDGKNKKYVWRESAAN